jgi:hypothetical protein
MALSAAAHSATRSRGPETQHLAARSPPHASRDRKTKHACHRERPLGLGHWALRARPSFRSAEIGAGICVVLPGLEVGSKLRE